jgi:type IV pilus assembly protein PilV
MKHGCLRDKASSSAPAQRGSVLIEVLVAILIFSFGVLGLVGLQGAMVRNETDAKFRTDAAFLVNEFVGLVGSDQANYASYATTPASVCAYAKCADWVRKVGAGLPSGKATVAYTPGTSGGAYTITVAWTMPDGTRHQYVATTSVYKSM